MKSPNFCCVVAAGLGLCLPAAAQSYSTPPADSASFDVDGTAHVTRVVPMPSTVSPEAQEWLASLGKKKLQAQTLSERRTATDAWRKWGSAEARRLYPVNVDETSMAGVRTDIISPLAMPEANRSRVLINLHGGGFVSDSGSLIEGVPMANLTKIKVVSVYYRLAPENFFPAAANDVVAVYKELLKTYKPQGIGIFGTSAGAVLTCEVAVRLKQLGLPLPAALGLFSVLTDFSRPSDSRQIFALDGFPGELQPLDPKRAPDDPYPAPPIAKIRYCLLCSRTLKECPRPCWSPAPATCCSAIQPFFIAQCSAPEMMRS